MDSPLMCTFGEGVWRKPTFTTHKVKLYIFFFQSPGEPDDAGINHPDSEINYGPMTPGTGSTVCICYI